VWTDPAAATEERYVDAPPPGGCDMRCTRCSHLGCLAAVPPARVLSLALPLLANRSGRTRRVELGAS
jgi:hypothetical protein